MRTINDGGPAFPTPGLQDDESFNGMSLRQHYAGKALQGYLASMDTSIVFDKDGLARDCFEMADAMLAAQDSPK